MPAVNKYIHLVLSILLGMGSVNFSTAQELVEVVVGETSAFHVTDHAGSSYNWQVYVSSGMNVPAPKTAAALVAGNDHSSVDIEWGREGLYYVVVTETDITGCTNTKALAVHVFSPSVRVDAGADVVTGGCQPVQLNATVTGQQGTTWTFSWEPAAGLDDPTLANPVFTPGHTTTFRVTATNNSGVSATGNVTVTVAPPVAHAGEDVMMYSGETVVLDGTLSTGEALGYLWATEEGVIETGEGTAHPVVSGFGRYVLQVTDGFGCTAYDTVNVGLLTHVPVAINDYDTTEYRLPVTIDLLANDKDADHDLDPGSLQIIRPPLYGAAAVHPDGLSVTYSPGRNFTGTDYFGYRICDKTDNCDEATVYVLVNNFRFQVPDAFSPNNDGINDYFEIPGIEYYEGNSIEIFNRWGSRVYRAENYGISTSPRFWDGKSNTGARMGNEQLPSGTYFYVLDLGSGQKRIAGSVYLDR